VTNLKTAKALGCCAAYVAYWQILLQKSPKKKAAVGAEL
jgi:hypothetical protein